MDENRMTDAAKEIGGKVQGAVGDVTGNHNTQAKGKANEIEGGSENLVGQAKDAVLDVAGQASDLAAKAINRGREAFPEAERACRQGGDAVAQYAKDTPLALVAMAGAIGYLLAMVIHGRR